MNDVVQYNDNMCQIIDIKRPHITIVNIARPSQHQTINMAQYFESTGRYRSNGYGVRFDERRDSNAFGMPDMVLRFL